MKTVTLVELGFKTNKQKHFQFHLVCKYNIKFLLAVESLFFSCLVVGLLNGLLRIAVYVMCSFYLMQPRCRIPVDYHYCLYYREWCEPCTQPVDLNCSRSLLEQPNSL